MTARIIFAFVNAGWKLLSLMPLGVLYVISDVVLYPFVYYVLRYRVKLVRANLAASFPDRDQAWLRRVERRFYHHFSDLTMEIIRMRSMPEAEIRRRMVFDNMDALRSAADRCGVVFVHIGHYCNWEWVAAMTLWMGPRLNGAQIYHPLENPLWDKAFLDVRGRFGGESIPMSSTLRRTLQLKRAGAHVAMGCIADQAPLFEAMRYFLPSFLHHPETPVYTGAEQMARKLGCEHFYLRLEQPKRGYYRGTLVPIDAVPQDGDQGVDGEQYPATRRFFTLLEEQINERPDLWLWTHNRWKRDKAGWEERQRALHKM